jgi:hypothetical protein
VTNDLALLPQSKQVSQAIPYGSFWVIAKAVLPERGIHLVCAFQTVFIAYFVRPVAILQSRLACSIAAFRRIRM